VLTQHTAWPNAARAIEALRARGLLTPARVAALDASDLAGVIRPAGTPRVKARRIQALTGWLVESMGGSFSRLRTAPLAPLRRRLLEISGLGPETRSFCTPRVGRCSSPTPTRAGSSRATA